MSALAVPAFLIPGNQVWRLSVDRYHRMIDAGTLLPEDPVELLDGVLVEKMPKSPAHRDGVAFSREALEPVLPGGWHLNIQDPVTLQTSEPEPDLSIIRGRRADFAGRRVLAADTGLVMEVSHASLERDRVWKKRLYARAGIPSYWLLDLTNQRLEVFSRPQGDDYEDVRVYEREAEAPLVLDGVEAARVAVDSLFGPGPR